MRDHGGDIGRARAIYGGAPQDWIDLSTGINRVPYPLPDLPPHLWQALPDAALFTDAIAAAQTAYQTQVDCLPLAGAQAAIQLVPYLRPPGTVSILSPTYNEHAAAFRTAGWNVKEVANLAELTQGDAAVVVNPNNPDGQVFERDALIDLSQKLSLLIVDESFADASPKQSLAPVADTPNIVVLRSFGKFYGLAGLRLGFALGQSELIDTLRKMAGPWAVSGPALTIGTSALLDTDWQRETRERLVAETGRLDQMAGNTGWALVGGTALFRLFHTPDAQAAQTALAQNHIWSRIFPTSKNWVRLGLPGLEDEWERLSAALG